MNINELDLSSQTMFHAVDFMKNSVDPTAKYVTMELDIDYSKITPEFNCTHEFKILDSGKKVIVFTLSNYNSEVFYRSVNLFKPLKVGSVT